MAKTFLGTTRGSDVRPIQYQGSALFLLWPKIVQILTQRLSPAHADVFAEPRGDRGGSETVDWYGHRTGSAVRMLDLPPEQQHEARVRIATLAGGIQSLAEQYVADRAFERQSIGRALQLALKLPDESYVWVIEGAPVVMAWGFEPAVPGVPPQDITRLGRVQPAVTDDFPATAPVQASAKDDTRVDDTLPGDHFPRPKTRRWITVPWFTLRRSPVHVDLPIWVRPLLIGAAMTLLTLLAGRLLSENWLSLQLDIALQDQSRLRQELDDLLQDFGRRRATCPTPPPSPEPKSSDVKVTDQQCDNKDLGFLNGRWEVETGMVIVETESNGTTVDKPITVEWVFDAKGKGTSTDREIASKTICTADVSATFRADAGSDQKTGCKNSVVDIDISAAKCTDGKLLTRSSVECAVGGDGKLSCKWSNKDPGTNVKGPFSVVLHR